MDFLVKEKHVVLLSPDVLKTEWNNHKEEVRNQILKSLQNLELEVKKKKLLQDISAEFFEEKLDDAKRLLNSQLDLIDDLLTNHWHFPFQHQMKLHN
jgi:hypothetical protein